MTKAKADNTQSAPTPHPELVARQRNFDRIMSFLNAKIDGADGHFSARSLARRHLFSVHAANEVRADEIRSELCDIANRAAEELACVSVRSLGEIAIKLAVAVAGQETGAECMDSTQFNLVSSALADLVILGDRELPDAGALNALDAEDLERREPVEGDEAQS